ncbi:hypothetical protein QYE76_035530 [Lolium multiflorum]|uniref:PB1-like domain-containing protein n=1 Tax=Lolium multiflorum TaxID=4521 RepID=A0AAD8R080_LOLMU|nr:hypothetical protein QYE76_035530 [Lolium multiflorum]
MDTTAEVWMAIKTMFATQSRMRVSNLRVALAKTKNDNMTSAQFFTKMKGLADELAAAARPIDEEELVEYLLAGLDDTYNPLFAAIGVNGAEDLTVSDPYAHVQAYENRIELLSDVGGSVNAAARGRGNRGRGHYGGRRGGRVYGGRGEGGRHQQRGGRGNGHRGGGRGGGNRDRDTTVCQICGKPGHEAWKCWHRYSDDEDEEEKNANMVSYGVDTNWYGDTGATDHITGELNKLTMKEKYHGRDQIHTANGEATQPRHATSPSPSFPSAGSDSGRDTRRDHVARDQARDQRDPENASSPHTSTDEQTESSLGSLQAQQEDLGEGSSAQSAPVSQPAPKVYKTRSKTGHNSNLFTAEVNHNGFFCGLGANLSYVSSTVDYIDLCSSENWSMTVMDEIMFMIGCQRDGKLHAYWCLPQKEICDGLVRLETDEDCASMLNVIKTEKCVVLFIDHSNFLKHLRYDAIIRNKSLTMPSMTSPEAPMAEPAKSIEGEASSSGVVVSHQRQTEEGDHEFEDFEREKMQSEEEDDGSDSDSDYELYDSDCNAESGDGDLFVDNIDKDVNDNNEKEVAVEMEDEAALEDQDLHLLNEERQVLKKKFSTFDPIINMENPVFKVGLVFSSIEEARKALLAYTARENVPMSRVLGPSPENAFVASARENIPAIGHTPVGNPKRKV